MIFYFTGCKKALQRIYIHKLFDNGLLIDKEYRIYLSPEVQSEYYQSFNGKRIALPSKFSLLPSKEALKSKKFEFINE